MLDSYFVQSRFPEGLVAEYSGGKQAHVRYPQILEADSGDSQRTKENALYGLINYLRMRVEVKTFGFFSSILRFRSEKIG